MKFSFYPAFQKADSPTKPRPIYMVGNFKNKNSYFKFKYPIGFSVAAKYWDEKRQKVGNFADVPNKDIINVEIANFEREVNRFISLSKVENILLTPSVLKDHLDTWKRRNEMPESPKEKPNLVAYTAEFIKNSATRINHHSEQFIKPRTLAKYRTAQAYIEKFATKTQNPLFLDSLDLKFYKDFHEFLRLHNMTPNTIGKHLTTVKTILRTAKDEGLPTTNLHESKSFKIPKNDGQHIYLNELELETLENLNLSDAPRLDRVRDLFLIGCWTGLRFSDFTEIKPENIKEDVNNEGTHYKALHLFQYKTGGKVVIPANLTVLRILDKYNGVLPKAISNQKFNEYLKEVAQKAGFDELIEVYDLRGGKREKAEPKKKWELVTTHTARRSFATNLYDARFPIMSLMKLTGHKTQVSFFKYIKLDEQQHARIASEFMINRNKPKDLKIAALAS